MNLYICSSENVQVGVPGILYPLVDRNISYRWFVLHREHPVAPYEQLIKKYENLTESDRKLAEAAVNALFTADEVEAFRSYLNQNHFLELRDWEIRLPLCSLSEIGDVIPLDELAKELVDGGVSGNILDDESILDAIRVPICFHTCSSVTKSAVEPNKEQIEEHRQLLAWLKSSAPQNISAEQIYQRMHLKDLA